MIMKNLLTLLAVIFFLLSINKLYSQELWGITPNGGPNENGTIFSIDIPTGVHEIEYDYPYAEGNGFHDFFESPDGFVYGIASTFNWSFFGIIARYNPQNDTYESIFNFSDSTGSFASTILQDPQSGLLYGTTYSGGPTPINTIFSFNPNNNEFSTLFAFIDTIGERTTDLIFHNNGCLYGVTESGGNNNRGVLYEFDISNLEYNILYNFNDSTGGGPKSIMMASDECLYGTAYFGGDYFEGVLFKFNIGAGLFKKCVDFNDSIGKSLKGSIIEASNGKLYGTTYGGGSQNGGVLFEFNRQTESYSVKHNFDYYKGLPKWNLSELKDGELYGGTNMGGYYHGGTIFKYDLILDSLIYLTDLRLNIGRYPSGSFIKCSNGRIISTTDRGGAFNCGSLFEFDISDYSLKKIHDFYGYTEFHNVLGTPVYSADGKIYGLTKFENNSYLETYGTLYSFNIQTKEHEVLDLFKVPNESLTLFDNKDLFYPSWYSNSIRGYFSDSLIAQSVCTITGTTGPITGNMVLASDGKLYGMQEQFGSNPPGTIYSFNPVTFEVEKKAGFWGPNGAYPDDNSLINIHDGFLYGLTTNGGENGNGVIFKYDPVIDTIIKLYDFSSQTGLTPNGKLLCVGDTAFYGHTRWGGQLGFGVIYKYSLVTNTYEAVFHFNGDDGGNPTGSLILASNGKLYGLTQYGGNYNKGVVFEFDMESKSYYKILDFNGANGSHPFQTSLVEVCDFPEIIDQPANVEVNPGDTALFYISTSIGDITGFQWYKDGLLIEQATNDSLFVEQATTTDLGKYYCEIITKCGSLFSDSATLSFPNDIFVTNLNSEINVYPNPVNNLLTIEFNSPLQNINIYIFDMYGKEVFQKQYKIQNEILIDLKHLDKGVYLLKALSENKEANIKLIKH